MASHAKRLKGAIITTVCALGVVAGCRSAVSTHVIPNPFCGGWDTKKVRGIPVTVKVPTHFEVRIKERSYIQPVTFGAFASVRFIEEEVREKEMVVFVDSVRPAAGTASNMASMSTGRQFFSSFQSEIDDRTIRDITTVLPFLPDIKMNLKKARAIAATQNTPPKAEDSTKLVYVDHLVAVKVFEVNSPSLTDDVREFVDKYMNCEQNCQKPVGLEK